MTGQTGCAPDVKRHNYPLMKWTKVYFLGNGTKPFGKYFEQQTHTSLAQFLQS